MTSKKKWKKAKRITLVWIWALQKNDVMAFIEKTLKTNGMA